MILHRAFIAVGLAVMPLLLTGCSDPSMTAVLVVVDDVPLSAGRLVVDVSRPWSEASTTLGDDVGPIAPEGHTSFGLLVPSAADSIEISLSAFAGDCVVARADSGCWLRACDELVMTLEAVAVDACGEPDGGTPLDDGRDAGGDLP